MTAYEWIDQYFEGMSFTSFEESTIGQMAMQKAQELFKVCDAEEKGFIIKRDMQRLTDELPGLTPDQLEEVFDSLDEDKNGFLTMEEFTKGFGTFLGLQMPEESDEDEGIPAPAAASIADELASAEASTRKVDSEGNDDEEDFLQLMDTLGASEVLRESDTTKELWRKLRNDDPTLLKNFEGFLSTVTSELQKSAEDYTALESALDQRTSTHDEEVKRLYDEMENQIRAEKESIIEKERQRAQREREDMEKEIQLRDAQLQEILSKHSELEQKLNSLASVKAQTEQENDRLQQDRNSIIKEKSRLEVSLDVTKQALTEAHSQLDTIKRTTKEQKRAKAQNAFRVTEGIAAEREGLVQQLDMLREMNKQLKDQQDERALNSKQDGPGSGEGENLGGLMDDGGMSQRSEGSGRSTTTPTALAEGGPLYGHPLSKVLNEPSLEESEYEVDDRYIPGTVPFSPPSGQSLMSELNGALHGDRIDPSRHQRTEPVGQTDPNSRDSPTGDPTNPERLFKVVFVGDSGVGKTCFLHRYCHNRFKATFSATIGVDFQVKSVLVEDRCIALQLWDTAGQERFRSITKQYFRKADGVCLLYDVTSELSFINLRNWFQSVKDGVEDGCVLCLIGNKVDLCDNDDNRVLKFKDGQKLADEFGAIFFETSASTGEGIVPAMQAMASLLCEKEDKDLEKALQLNEMQVIQRKKCCAK